MTRVLVQRLLTKVLPERVVGQLGGVGGRRRQAMSTKELFEVAEWQVLEDKPVQSGVALLARPVVNHRVHRADEIGDVDVIQVRHSVASHTYELRSKLDR